VAIEEAGEGVSGGRGSSADEGGLDGGAESSGAEETAFDGSEEGEGEEGD
jgi:hypothetical protein